MTEGSKATNIRRLALFACLSAVLLLLLGPSTSHADDLTDKQHELQKAASRRQYWEQKLQQARQEVVSIQAQISSNQQRLDKSSNALAVLQQRARAEQNGYKQTEQQWVGTLLQARTDLEKKRKEFTDQQAVLIHQLAADKKELDAARQDLTDATRRGRDLSLQGDALQRSIDQTEQDIALKNLAMKDVLVQVYKLSRTSDLELLLGSTTLNDALSRMTLLGRISQHDQDMLAQLTRDRQALTHSRQLLATQQSEVEELKNETEAEKQVIALRTEQGQQSLAALTAQLTAAEEQFAAQATDLTQQIDSIQAAMRQASVRTAATALPLQQTASKLQQSQAQQGSAVKTAQQQEEEAKQAMAQAQTDISSIGSTIKQLQEEAERKRVQAEADRKRQQEEAEQARRRQAAETERARLQAQEAARQQEAARIAQLEAQRSRDRAAQAAAQAQAQAAAAAQVAAAQAQAVADRTRAQANASIQEQQPAPVSHSVNVSLIRPINGGITQGFGPSSMWSEPSVTWGNVFYYHFHTGVDYGAAWGSPIAAAGDGTVLMTQWYGGYGNCIIIDHNGRITTLYGHLNGYAVRQGQYVRQGQTIGYVGSTGNSTGPHLHFEVRRDQQFQNPLPYIG